MTCSWAKVARRLTQISAVACTLAHAQATAHQGTHHRPAEGICADACFIELRLGGRGDVHPLEGRLFDLAHAPVFDVIYDPWPTPLTIHAAADGYAPGGGQVKLDEVPDYVEDSVLSAEDREFWTNSGFSFTGLGRAVLGKLTGDSNR